MSIHEIRYDADELCLDDLPTGDALYEFIMGCWDNDCEPELDDDDWLDDMPVIGLLPRNEIGQEMRDLIDAEIDSCR